jgi:hypothetical protein
VYAISVAANSPVIKTKTHIMTNCSIIQLMAAPSGLA